MGFIVIAMLMIHNYTSLYHLMASTLLINWLQALITSLCTNLKSLAQNTKPLAKNLCVCLDPDLNFESHVSNLTKTAFYHRRNIVKVQQFLSQADIERL